MLYELRAVNDEQDTNDHELDYSNIAQFDKPIFPHKIVPNLNNRRPSTTSEDSKKVLDFDSISHEKEHKPQRKMIK
uniref:Uncharacterized protein n=1 Tax=Acrobeloides nanus TaxID=290746 RepID=A0A914E4W8_9BILA